MHSLFDDMIVKLLNENIAGSLSILILKQMHKYESEITVFELNHGKEFTITV